jgi:hypothetical protein
MEHVAGCAAEFGQVRCPKFQLVLQHNLNDSDAKRGNKLAANWEDISWAIMIAAEWNRGAWSGQKRITRIEESGS